MGRLVSIATHSNFLLSQKIAIQGSWWKLVKALAVWCTFNFLLQIKTIFVYRSASISWQMKKYQSNPYNRVWSCQTSGK